MNKLQLATEVLNGPLTERHGAPLSENEYNVQSLVETWRCRLTAEQQAAIEAKGGVAWLEKITPTELAEVL